MRHTRRQSRLNVQEALSKHVFHNAVLTTFTFDPLFFEDYCLERFSSLASNNNISVIVDRGTYESVLAAPEMQQPKIANIRYLFHPVTVPGRFHAKVFLLTTRTAGRLVVGSANLTRPGLTSNAELVDEYNYQEGEDEAFGLLFRDAFEFLNKVAERWPSETLLSNLGELRRSSPWLDGAVNSGPDQVRLLHNLERSLWSQLKEFIPRPVDEMHVVSRFFDAQPALMDRVVEGWNPKKLYIYTQNGITTLTGSWLKHPLVRSSRAEILFCEYEDEGYPQALHGKAVVFVSGSSRRLVYGSANFTSAALLSDAGNGNVETLVLLEPLRKAFDPRRFIDPCRSAHRLASDDELQTDTNAQTGWEGEIRPLQLREAIVETDRISLYGDFPEDVPYSTVVTHVKVPGSPRQSMKMTRESVRRAFSRLPERLVPVLSQRSSAVWLTDDVTGKQVSNTLLLTNLVDIETHENVRQERHFREAKESASQFFAVLNELLRSGDTGPLLTFLSFCDIPLLNVPRVSSFRQRPVWEGREGMRSLGERNLQICKTLHEATLSFFDRHLKKLERHAKTRMLDGIPNFLHIFLSMGNLLRTQIERTVLAIEAKSGPVTVEEWADCRELWDTYFSRFRLMMECFWNGYLKKMSVEYSREEIKREFGPDLEAVHDLCDAMTQFRERIRLLQTAKSIRFGYFHCVLGRERWKRFASEIQTEQRQVEFAVLGGNEHVMPQVTAS